MEESAAVILQSVSAALQCISVGLNGAIIYTIWSKSLMRIPSSRFVFSLCLSHLLVSSVSLGVNILSFFVPSQSFLQNVPLLEQGNENAEGYSCVDLGPAILNHTLLYMTFAVSISTLLTVTLISLERYITIARPMKYKSIVTPTRCFTAISLSWILAAVFVVFPVAFFHKKTKQCGAFLVPIGNVGLYFALVITFLTILALTVMILTYSHIFTIAKSKCQKVQIGQFSSVSAPASISSDWPSSVYSSVHPPEERGKGGRGWFHGGSSRMTSSNSLLHWVLMANLRQHSSNNNPPLSSRSINGVKSPQLSPTNSVKSEPHHHSRGGGHGSSTSLGGFSRRRWRKILQQNSPRKTVLTILCLIGSVIITQVPMSLILFTHLESNPVLFYFCHDLLFAISSVSNPVLYGFLNRNIRDQLWKIFRPKTRRRNRQKRANSVSNNLALRGEFHERHSNNQANNIIINKLSSSRRGSLTSEESIATAAGAAVPSTSNCAALRRKDTAIIGLDELDRFKLRRKPTAGLLPLKFLEFKEFPPTPPPKKENSKRIEEEEQRELDAEERGNDEVEAEVIDDDEQLDDLPHHQLQLEFPRKPSQDSGADMSFSDEEERDVDDDLLPPPHPPQEVIAIRRYSAVETGGSSVLFPPQPLCKSCILLCGGSSGRLEKPITELTYLGLPSPAVLPLNAPTKCKSDLDVRRKLREESIKTTGASCHSLRRQSCDIPRGISLRSNLLLLSCGGLPNEGDINELCDSNNKLYEQTASEVVVVITNNEDEDGTLSTNLPSQ